MEVVPRSLWRGLRSLLRRVRFSLTVYPLLEGYSTFMRETPRP
jgi:hypothetical protein